MVGKNVSEVLKNLSIGLKIILDYQNNYVGHSNDARILKLFATLSSTLRFYIHNYFDSGII